MNKITGGRGGCRETYGLAGCCKYSKHVEKMLPNIPKGPTFLFSIKLCVFGHFKFFPFYPIPKFHGADILERYLEKSFGQEEPFLR